MEVGGRRRQAPSPLGCCPVCSCTLRPSDLAAHLAQELERLDKQAKRSHSPHTPHSYSDVYQRVKRNRERRLRVGRAAAGVECPVCGRQLAAQQAQAHVDACLRNNSQHEEDDESIDVEGDEERGFGDSYEWCSQVRVRPAALQLAAGGDAPHGALRIRRASTDTHLVVDGDEDVELYGAPQYSPGRLQTQEACEEESAGGQEERQEGEAPAQHSTGSEAGDTSSDKAACYTVVIEALKSRLKELERELADRTCRSQSKCLICMGAYREPVVSVQCWHVHCESCWLDSLTAKKTCPQCNAITTTQHLRRIYI